MKKIVVIGAGIAGLSTAFFLQRKYADALLQGGMELTLLEASPRIGGNIESINAEGFIFEAGPRGFLSGGYHTLLMADQAGVLDKVIVSSDSSRKRYLWYQGRLHLLPTNPFGALASPVIGFRTIKTILKEYGKRNRPSSPEETLAEFFTRRFSRDLVENLLDPVISGIYAGNVHRLHAESIFENLVRAERDHGSVIRGMMKGGGKKEKHEAYAQFGRRKLLSFDGGLETLITAVGNILRPHAHTGAKITELSRAANGYRISYHRNGLKTILEADTVIGCAPSLAMATLVRTLSPGLSEDLEKIEYAPIMVAALGYRNYRHPLNGFGFLAARNQQLGILGSLWNSSIFPRLSPEGSTSLTVMIGGACFPEIRSWSDEKILDVVRKEVALTLQIHRSADVVKLFRYERGIPQYNVGYPSVVAGIRRHLEDLPGFFLLGNYLGGVGVNDCTKNAFDFVQRM